MAEPAEVAAAILYLSSEASSYMIGQPLMFDGSLTRRHVAHGQN